MMNSYLINSLFLSNKVAMKMSKNVQEDTSEEEVDSPASLKDVIKGPMSKKFYLAMLGLEQQIAKKMFNSMETVLDLVEMYGRCVEHFDVLHDTAKWYFMERIQITLAESKTHELILAKEKEFQEEQRIAKQIKPMLKVENIQQNPLMRSQPKPQIKSTPPNSDQKSDSKLDSEPGRKISIRVNRETRSKKLTLIEQVSKGKQQIFQDQIVDQWKEEVYSTALDQLISNQLQDQTKHIQNRLERRRNQNTKPLRKANISMGFLDRDDIEEQDEGGGINE